MRTITIEFKKGRAILPAVIDVADTATLGDMATIARQLCLTTHSSAARVSVGEMTSIWVTPFDTINTHQSKK